MEEEDEEDEEEMTEEEDLDELFDLSAGWRAPPVCDCCLCSRASLYRML